MFYSYLRTFHKLGLKAIPMAADTGPISGDLSHEFIILADTGESKIYADKDIFEIDINKYEFSISSLNQMRNDFSSKYAVTDEKFDQNECNLIDLRDIRELQNEGQVEGANHIPRGMLEFWLDPESPYFKEGKLDMNKEMVLFCAGGLRSALAAKTLNDMGFKNVSHVDGGFGAIKHSKFKII